MRVYAPAAIVAGILLLASPVSSHHSQAMYQADKTVTHKGVVSKFAWINPHVWIYVDVTEADGKVSNWGIEANAASSMGRLGWTRKQFKTGDAVSFTVWPRKDGKELSLPGNGPQKPR